MTKKFLCLAVTATLFFNLFLPILNNFSFANTDTEKKNKNSYWSTKNAPIFYGATKITIKKDIIDNFDIKDTRFRIFAKDFEDGDLTTKIESEGTVDIHTEGTYSIKYKVKDSHNNETTLTVPVIVTDNPDAKINVERTLYTIPSVWNMDIAGFTRCNYGDRQLFGIYMPEGTSINVRVLEADSNIDMAFITDDSWKDTALSPLKFDKNKQEQDWVTISNNNGKSENKDTKEVTTNLSFDAVPLFTSKVLSKEDNSLTKTYKVELEYDTSVKELVYYHYKDDETEFFEKWKERKDSYAVVENEVLTIVVPFADVDKLINHNLWTDTFKTLDEYFEYYKKVVDRMDEIIGLSLNPEDVLDQNVRTKYLVRANVHGAGAAYYAGSHVGSNGSSIAAFFQMNWGGLHEIAHGYQGTFGRTGNLAGHTSDTMNLGETSNNILGYYIQTDKSIYTGKTEWLGKMSKIEEEKNQERFKTEKTYYDKDVSAKLYMVINLFDAFEGPDTYSKMFKWYRRQMNAGRTMTNQDAYVEAIADIYNVNIIPYMEAWQLDISDEVKEKVYSQDMPTLNILKDIVSEESITKVMNGEEISEKYDLVTNDILKNYNITGNLTINIDIDNIENVKGKIIKIKQADEIVKNATIEGNTVKIDNLPVGTYYVQMPVNSNYSQDYIYVQIKEGKENVYNYVYEKAEEKKYDNYQRIEVQGIYGTKGCGVIFSDNYTKANISFGGSNMGNAGNYLKILDENGNVIIEEKADTIENNVNYFSYKKDSYDVNIKPGYKIEIKNSNIGKVKVFSTLSTNVIDEFTSKNADITYVVTENGLKLETMTDDEAEKISYNILKEELTKIIKEYKENVTDEELDNKLINFKKKSEVYIAYNALKDEDKEEFKELINRILQGGKPVITTATNTLTYKTGTNVDLYSLINAKDNEDGEIKIDENSTQIETDLNKNEEGQYNVTYSVSDSDNNITQYKMKISMEGEKITPGLDNNNNDNNDNNNNNNNNNENPSTSVEDNNSQNNNSQNNNSQNNNSQGGDSQQNNYPKKEENENLGQTTNTYNYSQNDELDDEPKTGDFYKTGAEIVTLLSLAGAAVIKKYL